MKILKGLKIYLTQMEEKASAKDANAIVALNIAYNNPGGTIGNTILITAYGTAVKYVEK